MRQVPHTLATLATLAALCAALWATPTAAATRSEVLAELQSLRAGDCAPADRSGYELRQHGGLDLAAGYFADGRSAADAVAKVGHRYFTLASVKLTGTATADQRRALLRREFCGQMKLPRFRDVGIHVDGDRYFILMTSPEGPDKELTLQPLQTMRPTTPAQAPAPAAQPAPALRTAPDVIYTPLARQVLALVNDARSRPRQCGSESFAAATSLRLAPELLAAAEEHNADMTRNNYFSHTGRDGSSVGTRVARLGYNFSTAGENIAMGQRTATEVVDDWLKSPGHCSNIMNGAFREMGIAVSTDGQFRWTQTFGTRMGQ
jgi:uncharacterized protein YkwD